MIKVAFQISENDGLFNKPLGEWVRYLQKNKNKVGALTKIIPYRPKV